MVFAEIQNPKTFEPRMRERNLTVDRYFVEKDYTTAQDYQITVIRLGKIFRFSPYLLPM